MEELNCEQILLQGWDSRGGEGNCGMHCTSIKSPATIHIFSSIPSKLSTSTG